MIVNAIVLTAALAATKHAAHPAKHTAPAPKPAADAAAAPAAADSGDPLDAGLVAFRRKNFARAEADFEKAVDANPKSAAAHFYLGYAIYKTAEPKHPFHPDKQKAAAEFAKAFDLDPDFRPDWGGAATAPVHTKKRATAKAQS
jgi:tetratricopeptide (TPR) repeat protein